MFLAAMFYFCRQLAVASTARLSVILRNHCEKKEKGSFFVSTFGKFRYKNQYVYGTITVYSEEPTDKFREQNAIIFL
jgi:hypothetical protein